MSHPRTILRYVVLALASVAMACGSPTEKGPKKGGKNNANNVATNNENNVTPNNVTPNNVTPNNVTPNNVTPNNNEPCVGITPASLNFGDVAIGTQAEAMVTIENCSGTASLTLDDASAPAGFEVALPAVAQIPPETSFPLTVLFAPVDAGGHVGMINITTSAGTVSVNVQGNGLEGLEGCPTPVALGRADAGDVYSSNFTATSSTTIQLSAADSVAPSVIERYEWTLTGRPQGSTAQLSSTSSVEPSLFLDQAGVYQADLRVFTAQSPDDCPAARVTITANGPDPDEILVQLVWDTPGDANQTDTLGTDMDLHYMHPLGTWNMAPYDCFWNNKNADWGADGMASVDIDDVDGAGPENISHSNAGSAIYQVGVHYFQANTYGASTATLRVYRGGSLNTEVEQLLNTTGEFWHVGSFNAANDVFTLNGSITDGFPP